MHRPPKKPSDTHIRKRAEAEMKMQAQLEDIHQENKLRFVAQWQSKLDTTHAAAVARQRQRQVGEELDTANEERKLVRRERLRHLLNTEQLMYEEELAARGLAVVRQFY
eukprot:TRINITY_DN3048_c0_g2_i2.p1 TRINITY_DN3048_c0_g2~~TRINITY_DN3048_c0_g2_i2.p1  ORF type:complete len:109 (-),score=21.48 TRINITY_DN3048_c0_g2_i2:340-666(-)